MVDEEREHVGRAMTAAWAFVSEVTMDPPSRRSSGVFTNREGAMNLPSESSFTPVCPLDVNCMHEL